MRRRLLTCAAFLMMLASLQGTVLADEYGPKVKGPKVVWVALYLNAMSSDPALKGLRGYTPAETKVHVGDHIVFFNIDDEVHTATVRLSGAFPPNASKATGHRISDAWSTGELKANGESSPIFVDKAGKYMYGCIHHFADGMQATIVVEP